MKSRLMRMFLTCTLAIAISAALAAQLQLGGTGMMVSRASTLSVPVTMGARAFAMRVGGVAFDKTARPAASLTVNALGLRYDAAASDGRRLILSINGSTLNPLLPDWQLVPIARLAQSPSGSLVTLFGEMPSRSDADAVREKGGRIVNYHPQLQNTLLGLRILQLDMLIINPDSVELPTVEKAGKRVYLLGLGEQRPEPARGRTAFAAIERSLSNHQYRSYIVSDYGRAITFDVSDGELHLTGTPYFYFWRSRGDSPDFERDGEQIIAAQVRRELERDRAAGKVVSQDTWCRTKLDRLEKSAQFVDLSNSPGFEALRSRMHQFGATDPCGTLEAVRYTLEETRVIHVKELSDAFSLRPDAIAAINPAVWESAVRTMQYGALFRYCRAKFPIAWEQFAGSLTGVTPQPPVSTPTEVYIPSEVVAIR
jgi:hypothetical protein